MIKLLYSLRRHDGLSRRDFQEHWLGYHCPHFGLRNEPARMYVVYPALLADGAEPAPRRGSEYDGVAVVWFDGLDGVKASMGSDLVAEAAVDERRFIDHDLSVAVLAEEHVTMAPRREPSVVLFEHVRRAGGCSFADFARWWRDGGSWDDGACDEGAVAGRVLNLVLPSGVEAGLGSLNDLGENRETWDGIATTYFESELLARMYLERLREAPRRMGASLVDEAATVRTLTRRRAFRHLVR